MRIAFIILRQFLILNVPFIILDAKADPAFRIPTPNQALWEGSEKGHRTFFAPTRAGKWESGRFGCVRSGGWKFHEGIDIRYTKRNKQGEPTDPVFSTAEGIVCYANQKASLSNYGKYIILGHKIEDLEIYTIYAHLSQIEDQVVAGRQVEAGARIATMGRTTNSGTIARSRAHLHFEITLVINEKFDEWFQIRNPGSTNDHGAWNGRNFLGLNPESIFREQARLGENFSLRNFLRKQESFFTVFVTKTQFPWLRRYVPLMRINSTVSLQEATGFEITFNAFGLPYQLSPSKHTTKTNQSIELLDVQENIYQKYKCRKLLKKQGSQFQLSQTGLDLIHLLTFQGKQ
ncbi:MAG: M23 family metallopeptidase [Verrucomicrobia bacterium]|jgi:peptidoglycan LD-endopeptidase LytH|nr:M23 family metallopeptidase [Verrucomicrobiota bacterium]